MTCSHTNRCAGVCMSMCLVCVFLCARACVFVCACMYGDLLSHQLLTHEQASAIPTAGLVAYAALRCGGLPESEEDGENGAKVAILGGSGGVGTFAIQIAKRHYGAFVLVCCSGKHKVKSKVNLIMENRENRYYL